jgi:hypothetical protein
MPGRARRRVPATMIKAKLRGERRRTGILRLVSHRFARMVALSQVPTWAKREIER